MNFNRNRNNPQNTVNFAPSRFMKKIPNINVMREFFISKGKFYCNNFKLNV